MRRWAQKTQAWSITQSPSVEVFYARARHERHMAQVQQRIKRWRKEAQGRDPIKRRIARFALAQAEGKRGMDIPPV